MDKAEALKKKNELLTDADWVKAYVGGSAKHLAEMTEVNKIITGTVAPGADVTVTSSFSK